MAGQEGITVNKAADFPEWYNQAVLKGELADFTVVKGFMFIRPYGYEIWELIQDALNRMIKASGHKNAYCPTVIPEKLLEKEKEHLQGFSPEVFFITHAGSSKLEERLLLKPTGETVIYEAYSRWIRSWRDLPLLLNYWNANYRAEIKMTKLFLRTAEFLWQEGHTVHETREEADKEVALIMEHYRELVEEYLAIPVLTGKKSEREKFPGALYTMALEALMPDGKALQMGTSHNLGQHFSRPFSVTFIDRKQKKQYAWQTSWGVSTRLVGALVMVHGDNGGLVLPPRMAPVQAVIIPIYQDKNKAEVLKAADDLKTSLGAFRVECDSRDGYTPGWKFNEWELRGVPLRIELGPRDIAKKQVIVVRRDSGEKEAVKLTVLTKNIEKTLADIQKSLFQKATAFLQKNIHTAKNLKEFKAVLEEKRGIILAGWCSSVACEKNVKDTTTADIRLIPFKKQAGKCVVCGKDGRLVYFAKAY